MKRTLPLMLSLAVLANVHAVGGPDDQYLEIYSLIQQADGLSNDPKNAASRYIQAQTALKKLQTVYPNWQPDIIKFRIEYVGEKLAIVQQQLVQTAAPAQPVPAPSPKTTLTQEDVANLNDQIKNLTSEKNVLERKLKEALSAQPAATDPKELAKAEQTIADLKKERDLLSLTLEQQKTSGSKSSGSADKSQEKALKVVSKERDALQDQVIALSKAMDQLKSQAAQNHAAMQKKLAASRKGSSTTVEEASEGSSGKERRWYKFWSSGKKSAIASAPEITAPDNALLQERDALLKQVESLNNALVATKAQAAEERAALEKKLVEAATPAPAPTITAASVPAPEIKAPEAKKRWYKLWAGNNSRDLATSNKEDLAQIANLRARVNALEAKAIPYTTEELALIKKANAGTISEAALPKPTTTPEVTVMTISSESTAVVTNAVRSIKDLPTGATALMTEGQRAYATGNYALAEEKFSEVLRQDDRNVYVLSRLASAQLSAGHLEKCEKTLQQALAVDPNDAASLFLMGNVKVRQDKLDEALDALSRSAAINPTNAATQNSLGGVLNQKGLRTPAEAALRTALKLDPNYAEAHHNLALVYAMQKPPFMELSRWHYRKALDLGYPKNVQLEKLIETK